MDDQAQTASPRVKDTRSNKQRIIDYCTKNEVDTRFFSYYDLWVMTKGGNINLLATKRKHEKFFVRQRARQEAKGKPHVCSEKLPSDYTNAEREEIANTSRQYARFMNRQMTKLADRGLDVCHPGPATVMANSSLRHKVTKKIANSNINMFVRTLTADKTLSGPRQFRKSVVRLRLEEMRKQVNTPIQSKIPSGGIQGELIRPAA